MVPNNDSPMIVSIGGAPSAGTTLLADLVDSIPGAACGPELNLLCIPEAFRFDAEFRRAAHSTSWETGCCYAPRSRFLNSRHLGAIGLDEPQARALIESADSLLDLMRRLALGFGRFRGRPIYVMAEKTPANVSSARIFLESFPEGRFIHVVRDGRAVAASLRRRGYSLWEAAIIWLAQTAHGHALREHPRCMTVRYEDLAEDPFRTASRLGSWLGVDSDPREIENRFRGNTYRANLPRVAQWSTAGLPPGTVHRTASFGDELNIKEIAFLESCRLEAPGNELAGVAFDQLLAELGYRVDGTSASPDDATVILSHADFLLRSRNVDGYRRHLLWQSGFQPPARRVRLHARARAGARPESAHGQVEAIRQWLALPAGASVSSIEKQGRLRAFLAREGLPMPDGPGCPRADAVAMGGRSLAAIAPPQTPDYRLRALGQAEELVPAADDAAALGRLAATHAYACCRKIEAGQPFGDENALVLALACRVAQRASLLEAEFDRARQALRASRTAKSPDVTEFPWPKDALASSHVRRLHDAVMLGACSDRVPEYRSPVRGFLVGMVLEPNADALRAKLEALLRDHFDRRSGMIAETAPDTGSPRPYLSPLVPLALVCAAERLGMPLTSPGRSIGKPTPPEGDSLDDWLVYAERLLTPPELPIALEPQRPNAHASTVVRSITRTAISATIDRSGWAVAVLPAPPSATFVLSIRHDVDRPFRPEHAERLLSMHERFGRCTSVYFRPSTFDDGAATELRDAGCELGLHLSQWDDAHRELLDRLRTLVGGSVGVTYHGGLGSRYWRGLRSVRADLGLGAAYTELLHEWYPDPRPVRLGPSSIMATPLSVKVDAQPEWVDGHLQLVRDFRGHAILELHPDLPGESWERVITGCLAGGALPRRIIDHVENCRAASNASAEARIDADGLQVTVRGDAPLTMMVRTDPSVFVPDHADAAQRLPGRLAPGGRWSAYPMSSGECTVLLRPMSASTMRAPASPCP